MSTPPILAFLAQICGCGSLDSLRPPTPPVARYHLLDEKPASTPGPSAISAEAPAPLPDQQQAAAARVMAILRQTRNTGAALRAELDAELDAEVHAAGWSEWLAERILDALKGVVRSKEAGQEPAWAAVLADAYAAAKSAAETEFEAFWRYAKEHPGEVAAKVVVEIFVSLVALGVLVRVMGWVVRVLGYTAGFGELGPVAGTCFSPPILLPYSGTSGLCVQRC